MCYILWKTGLLKLMRKIQYQNQHFELLLRVNDSLWKFCETGVQLLAFGELQFIDQVSALKVTP